MDGFHGWPKRERHGNPPPPAPPQTTSLGAGYDSLRRPTAPPLRALGPAAGAYSYGPPPSAYDPTKKDPVRDQDPRHGHPIPHALPHPHSHGLPHAHHALYARLPPPMPGGFYAPPPAYQSAPSASYGTEYGYRAPPPLPPPPARDRPPAQIKGIIAAPSLPHPPHPHRQHLLPPARDPSQDTRPPPSRLAPPPQGPTLAPPSHQGRLRAGPPHQQQQQQASAPLQALHPPKTHSPSQHPVSQPPPVQQQQQQQQSAPQRLHPHAPTASHSLQSARQMSIPVGPSGHVSQHQEPVHEDSQVVGSTSGGSRVVMVTSDPQSSRAAAIGGNEHSTGQYRQLKVEDALKYLEQVKSQFADNPTVYNQFLDIMKEFKAQSIDTAEVIRRVSNLFQGHRTLILGFNTFLPPGYKIELRDDPATGCITTGFSAPGGTFSTLAEGNTPRSTAVTQSMGVRTSVGHSMAPVPLHHQVHHQQPSHQMPPPSGLQPHQAHQTHQTHPRPLHQVHQTHSALSSHPHQVQSAHAEAQARAQAHAQHVQVHTAQAQAQAAQAQHRAVQAQQAQVSHPASAQRQPQQVDVHEQVRLQRQPIHTGVHSAVPISAGHSVDTKPTIAGVGNDGAVSALAGGFGSPATATATEAGKPIEFDQAVTYVNKIKSRFIEDEAVYKRFLDILQTYQKEQRTIKQVYKQVSELFRDHTDLLEEFSHFLPEAPQAGGARATSTHEHHTTMSAGAPAKGRPSQQRQREFDQSMMNYQTSSGGRGGYPTMLPGHRDYMPKVKDERMLGTTGTNATSKTGGSHNKKNTVSSDGAKKPRRGGSSAKKGSDKDGKVSGPAVGTGPDDLSEAPAVEMEFFEELQKQLGEEGKLLYTEIIKSLSLVSQEIICAEELLRLIDSILGDRKHFSEAFRVFINHTDPMAAEHALAMLRRGPIDLATTNMDSEHAKSASGKLNPVYANRPLSQVCHEFGEQLPGSFVYSSYPKDLGGLQCSGMSESDRQVLNFSCASHRRSGPARLIDSDTKKIPFVPRIPLQTALLRAVPKLALPGQHSGAAAHTNAYNDGPRSPTTVLDNANQHATRLSVDDQRVELDVLIASAETVIKKLERIAAGEKVMLTAVDTRPIELIYKEAYLDVAEFLKATPLAAAPLILARLNQRLKDWIEARKRMQEIWRTHRFSSAAARGEAPKMWTRRELVSELVPQGNSMDGDSPQQKEIRLRVLAAQENEELVLDLLWYILEWVVDSVEEAEACVICVKRVYSLFLEGHLANGWLIADEHLYTFIRLLGAVSERIDYIQNHNLNGTAVEKTSQALKDLLAGSLTAVAFEQHCKSTYGQDQAWQVQLADMGVVLKRFGNAAKRLPERSIALQLVSLAEERLGVQGLENIKEVSKASREDGDGKREETSAEEQQCEGQKKKDIDVMQVDTEPKVKEDTRDDIQEEERKSAMNDMAYVRECMRITEDCRCEMFRVDFLTKLVRNEPETDVILSHVERYIASQHPQIDEVANASSHKVDVLAKPSSAFTRYLEKRSRKFASLERQRGVIAKVIRHDGLDIRYDVEIGKRLYVDGTEDFVFRADSRARKLRRLSKTGSVAPGEAPVKEALPSEDVLGGGKTALTKQGHAHQAADAPVAEQLA